MDRRKVYLIWVQNYSDYHWQVKDFSEYVARNHKFFKALPSDCCTLVAVGITYTFTSYNYVVNIMYFLLVDMVTS